MAFALEMTIDFCYIQLGNMDKTLSRKTFTLI